jgi:pyruvate/2-oxoglutarate/acetoin dehydrogenase E1 component
MQRIKENAQSNFADEIRKTLENILELDSKSLIMGLGVTDPKGVFGTTLGLFEEFGPKRVIETPTSENAMTGIGVGLAISGFRPIMVHQRMDFFLLAMDQLVNSAAKWHYMFGAKTSVPLTIRLITGRGWGQGPTHSQNLHAWFTHIPGLKVVMPAFATEVGALLRESINDPNPVIFIEDRWTHGQQFNINDRVDKIKLGTANLVKSGKDITIVSSGYMTIESLKAVNYLKKFNIGVDLIDLRTIKPYDKNMVIDSVNKTKNLIVVDSGFSTGSFGNQVLSDITQSCFPILASPPRLLAAQDIPEPTSHGVIGSFKLGAINIAENVLLQLKIEYNSDSLSELVDTSPDIPDKNFTGPF